MKSSKIHATSLICVAASTLLAMIISGTVFGAVNLTPVVIGIAGGFVVASHSSKSFVLTSIYLR